MKTKIATLRQMLLYFALFINVCCCTKNRTPSKNIEGISVLFLPGSVDSNIPYTCNDFKEYMNRNYDDTIFLNNQEYDSLKTGLKHLYEHRHQGGSRECDIRLFVQMDSIELGFGTFNCACDIDGHELSGDSYVSYLLKCKSTYYNYFAEEDLYYDQDIEKYGVPSNYRYGELGNASEKAKETIYVLIAKDLNQLP